MTRKDYIIIAAALRETIPPDYVTSLVERRDNPTPAAYASDTHDRAVHKIAVALLANNPAFNRTRFMCAVYG